MVKGTDWLTWSWENEYGLHSSWGMALKRAPALGKARYTRVGTAILSIIDEKVESIFPPLQQNLKEDDYLDIDNNGVCTIVVV